MLPLLEGHRVSNNQPQTIKTSHSNRLIVKRLTKITIKLLHKFKVFSQRISLISQTWYLLTTSSPVTTSHQDSHLNNPTPLKPSKRARNTTRTHIEAIMVSARRHWAKKMGFKS